MTATSSAAASNGIRQETPLSEWLVALVGLGFLISIIAYLPYRALTDNGTPPDIAVAAIATLNSGHGYLLRLRVSNRGGNPTAGLTVEGELSRDGEQIELSDMTFDYVPAHSQREGGLFFTQDPRQYRLKLRAKGYQVP